VAPVAAAFVSLEYVYLFLVVEYEPVHPNANIPKVLFPVADPTREATLEAVADALTQPE
jgi:hypothetical protein